MAHDLGPSLPLREAAEFVTTFASDNYVLHSIECFFVNDEVMIELVKVAHAQNFPTTMRAKTTARHNIK